MFVFPNFCLHQSCCWIHGFTDTNMGATLLSMKTTTHSGRCFVCTEQCLLGKETEACYIWLLPWISGSVCMQHLLHYVFALQSVTLTEDRQTWGQNHTNEISDKDLISLFSYTKSQTSYDRLYWNKSAYSHVKEAGSNVYFWRKTFI